jgi:hypothetical protein
VRRHLPRLIAGLALVVVAWMLLRGVHPALEGLVMFAPGLFVAFWLLAGRYLGEDRIERARAARARPDTAHDPAPVAAPRPRPARTTVPRGGLLLGASLAVRPPPALS